MNARHQFYGVTLECIQGNIAHQPDMEAIVNASNAELRTGGGVAGAIHRGAGPELEAACRHLAPIRPGEAVITGAYHLPNCYVIHCLGPVFGVDVPSDKLLACCYRNALQLAEENGVRSIAFPAISTGVFGYPSKPAAQVALQTILDCLPVLSSVKHIRFVLFSETDLKLYKQVLMSFQDHD